jgi:arabinose-5-phosphate isomerase
MADALVVMSQKGFGIAGVMEAGRLAGVISDGDLRRNMADLMARNAGEVATRSPRVVPPDLLAVEALAMMSDNKITALFVTDAEHRPLGILHLHDCLRAGLV